MRNGQKRMRGRGNNHRKSQNPMTRVYESNGPDVKIRGTASHIAEKYIQLARDAQTSGDHVAAENYYQHAEHYFRLIAAAQEQFRQQNPSITISNSRRARKAPPTNTTKARTRVSPTRASRALRRANRSRSPSCRVTLSRFRRAISRWRRPRASRSRPKARTLPACPLSSPADSRSRMARRTVTISRNAPTAAVLAVRIAGGAGIAAASAASATAAAPCRPKASSPANKRHKTVEKRTRDFVSRRV